MREVRGAVVCVCMSVCACMYVCVKSGRRDESGRSENLRYRQVCMRSKMDFTEGEEVKMVCV